MTFIDTAETDARAIRALAVAEEARRRGHEIMLVGLHRGVPMPEITPLGALADERGVLFRVLRQRSPLDPGLLGQISAAFGRYRPAVFVSHDFTGMILHRLSRTRPPRWFVLWNPHEELAAAERNRPRLIRRIEVRALNRSDGIFVADEAHAGELAARGVNEEVMRGVRAEDDSALAGVLLDAIEAGGEA